MAIGPEQVGAFNEEDLKELAALESALDEALGIGARQMQFTRLRTQAMEQELVRRYRAAGWHVLYEDFGRYARQSEIYFSAIGCFEYPNLTSNIYRSVPNGSDIERKLLEDRITAHSTAGQE